MRSSQGKASVPYGDCSTSVQQPPGTEEEQGASVRVCQEALSSFIETLCCSLCHRLMEQPNTFSTCGHTFCRPCVLSRLEGIGISSSVCPECKQPGWKKDLHMNHQVMNAVHHVKSLMKEVGAEYGRRRSTIAMLQEDVALIESVLHLCHTIPVLESPIIVPDSQEESQKRRSTLKDRNVAKRPSVGIRKLWERRLKPRKREGQIRMVVDALKTIDPLLCEDFATKFQGDVQIDSHVTKETTHVVVETNASLLATRRTRKYIEGCALGCWIVSHAWIDASIQAGEIVDERNYQVKGYALKNTTQVDRALQADAWNIPEKSRLRHLAGKKGIFHNMIFVVGCALGEEENEGSKRRSKKRLDLMHLIHLADGTAVTLDDDLVLSVKDAIGIVLSNGDPSEKKLQKLGCTCIMPSVWLYDCITSGKVLPTGSYSSQSRMKSK